MTKDSVKEKPIVDIKNKIENEHILVLHNDDYHTFDYVIDALINICEHTEEQATQCTMLVHYKGSCDVKKGSFSKLKPLRRALTEKDLKATIN